MNGNDCFLAQTISTQPFAETSPGRGNYDKTDVSNHKFAKELLTSISGTGTSANTASVNVNARVDVDVPTAAGQRNSKICGGLDTNLNGVGVCPCYNATLDLVPCVSIRKRFLRSALLRLDSS